jgi:tripartite-type tricarboxylate transporter receptor subunit TctC
MNRRKSIMVSAAIAAAAIVNLTTPGLAETYPSRTVRIITAGVGTFHDVVARILAQHLGQRWHQAVVVENQPAAGLTVGAAIAAKSAPDGYTLLLGDRGSLAAAPSLYKDLRYSPTKDLQPITLVARAPAILAVNASVPVSNLREFIEFAKQQRDPVLFASAGNGSFPHLTGVLFGQLANVPVQVVQFRGGNDAATAVLGGHATFTALSSPAILPHVIAGQAKALAITSARRLSGASQVPTGAEAGLPGLIAENWVGMMVPTGTPEAITSKLNRDISEVLELVDVRERLLAQGAEVAPGTPEQFAEFIASETLRLRKLIEAAGLRKDGT